ncbi:hypothetical protein PG996_012141 [Apiospora saccharicola]|uniref:Uncharacterized protein n=1 Tax=Apiospora saccharicola TaxID=335842 RepID=A0ABR1U1R8_9PEZI
MYVEAWLESVEEQFLDTHEEPPPPVPPRNPLRLVKTQEKNSLSSTSNTSDEKKKAPQKSTEATTDHPGNKVEPTDKRTQDTRTRTRTQLPTDSHSSDGL